MNFHILTIFPELFKPYLNESILGKAIYKELLSVDLYDIRKYTTDKHNNVDDKPYGGGPGMVMAPQPIVSALEDALKRKSKEKTLVIFLSPGGKDFNDKRAIELSKKYKDIVILAGRYEGIDERVKKVVKDRGFRLIELSTGPYILSGGELPSLTIIDAISRKIEGVLGKTESLEENRYGPGLPSYTRPENFKHKGREYKVPKVLISGNHKKIDEWRRDHTKK
ncbi:MAG: tRNA (guanosine(37)-N1)-methyltransferase TrmD [Candidatus Colwellbacteria bacterium CG10_big_fil_rev_8_21_14_0_10_41_28]|uniref:tRNA (guanine-N(1)-)-methyltransferase n=1 Tax=Candidatus Colwellbacteria bacterium CG10_big_fil_rev_8_21_14_0_10_41_28 TaxID=1974539 RepID=A0A2H0VHE3_9BACT|nr:MAG: tRNA (guanosine(37)-N1)-methyltransferase TrmD [Candidatus Colwellbacteria bacterium CG10_big_fil_rev_8_21_14_0_10_41_28]